MRSRKNRFGCEYCQSSFNTEYELHSHIGSTHMKGLPSSSSISNYQDGDDDSILDITNSYYSSSYLSSSSYSSSPYFSSLSYSSCSSSFCVFLLLLMPLSASSTNKSLLDQLAAQYVATNKRKGEEEQEDDEARYTSPASAPSYHPSPPASRTPTRQRKLRRTESQDVAAQLEQFCAKRAA